MAVRPPATASTKALRCLPSRPPQKFSSIGQRCFSRSYIYLKRRGANIPAKSVYNYQFVQTVFSAFGPQEAKLSDDDVSKNVILTDCGTDQECAAGGIVALGKFDALHIGHRELAIKASNIGSPFLLSFVGMEEVLGLPTRLPIVAKCDRKRVLSTWASLCGDVVPIEFQVEFPKVRHLTPRQFVEKLSKDLRVSGVVAGENYRFGYKASGDAKELVKLCKEYNLEACIVSHVMDKTRLSSNGSLSNNLNSYDKGQVSSTRVREALATCDMEHVTQLLGRKHRLFLMVDKECKIIGDQRFIIPKSCVLNQPPGNNVFDNCRVMVEDQLLGDCRVVVDSDTLDIELYSNTIRDAIQVGQLISIEFGVTHSP